MIPCSATPSTIRASCSSNLCPSCAVIRTLVLAVGSLTSKATGPGTHSTRVQPSISDEQSVSQVVDTCAVEHRGFGARPRIGV